jgi:hypothetical protein
MRVRYRTSSDVLAWPGSQKPGQAKQNRPGQSQAKSLAYSGLWPWLEIFKATGHGLSHGFGYMTETKYLLIKVLNFVTKLYSSDFFFPPFLAECLKEH